MKTQYSLLCSEDSGLQISHQDCLCFSEFQFILLGAYSYMKRGFKDIYYMFFFPGISLELEQACPVWLLLDLQLSSQRSPRKMV